MSGPGEVGRLSAALTLDGAEAFQRRLAQVGQTFTETSQKGSAFGRAGEQAFRVAAGATTALTVAAAGYLTILTKTGVAYNSLQQNSRAALSVLLGGTEQANAQMDKLDAFARNSPFAKSVFIQAQQQLLGFGVEAAKVIPTLDAIQQTVASFGGNAEQISAITDVLARLQSQGRLSGEALERLGYYGVDAARIIGEKMGLTAAEIKEMASKPGGIPVEQIWDPLVQGLQDNFGGAADKVKEQWSGAVDRIMAANRDLGAHIAEPFVSQQGGGMAVTWGNQVADVLRAIEKQAVPVMGILTQRGMPFFAEVTKDLDGLQQRISRWDASKLDVSLDKLAGHAPALGALAGAVLAVGAQVGPLGRMFSVLGISANPVVAAFIGLAAASPEVRASLKGVLDVGKPLVPVATDLARVLSGQLTSALPLVASGVDLLAGVLRIAVDLLRAVPTPVLAGVTAFLALQKVTGGLDLSVANRGLKSFMESIKDSEAIRAYNAGLTPTSALLAGVSSTSSAAKAGVIGLGDAMKTAFLSNPIGIALTVVSTAIGLWAMANANAQQKVEEHRARVADLKGTLNETTGALTNATRSTIANGIAGEDMAKKLELAKVSGDAFVDAAIEGGAAAAYFQKSLSDSAKEALSSAGKTDSLRQTADALGVSYDELVNHMIGVKDISNDVAKAHAGQGDEAGKLLYRLTTVTDENQKLIGSQRDVNEAYREYREAVEDAQAENERYREAMRQVAASMDEAGRSNQRFNDALAVARDITQDAETRVRALKQALDELKGGAISAEEAQKRLSETNLSLAEGLAQTNEEGTKLWQGALDGAGNIDISTRSGLAFADAMSRSRDAMLDAARAASDQALATGDVAGAVDAAKAAGDQYIATLQQTMADADLTQAQIDALIGKYLDVPSVVATLLTTNGTIDEVDQQLLSLASQIESVPDRTITIDDPESPELMQRMKDLGLTVEKIPGTKQIRVTQTGADTVAAVLNELTKPRTVQINFQQGTGLNPSAAANRADGGIDGPNGRQFFNGGFASGIYAGVMGGIPKMGADGSLHFFAEKHLGVDWETYISSRASKARNASLLMETAQRIGFPVIPVAALRGIRGFADGGTATRSASTLPDASRGPITIPVYGHRGMDVDDLAEAVWQKIEGRL